MAQSWWQNAVIYQIYPKSFMDANGDGIGDLQGIISKLDYLQQLGVDALWLSPIYVSPQIDNGYDISDYRQIDQRFGTNADMYALIAAAHQRHLKIVMDLVANHTSDQAVWFQESKKSRHNYFSDFYIWRDPKSDGSEPNNWAANFGGSAWTYVPERQQYYLHYYAKEQPDLNWENPLVRQAIYDMMRFWKAQGVDGWRMDVISSISKDQHFTDYPDKLNRPYVLSDQNNGPRLHEFIQEMNREVLAPFNMMSVGEAPGATAANVRKFVDPERKELDMVFSFEHMRADRKAGGVNGKWDYDHFDLLKLKDSLTKWQDNLRDHGWNALYFENHDRARIVSRWGNDQKYRYQSATAFATVLHGMQGTPFVYQGEEIGMTNATFALADYEDIEITTNYRQYVEQDQTMTATEFLAAAQKLSRDHARTPMQWDTSANAGFTIGRPWFQLNPNYRQINVATDRQQHASIFKYYQQLIQLRHQFPILTTGRYQLELPTNQQLFVYRRVTAEQSWLIVANLSAQIVPITRLAELVTTEFVFKLKNNTHRCALDENIQPYEAFILELI